MLKAPSLDWYFWIQGKTFSHNNSCFRSICNLTLDSIAVSLSFTNNETAMQYMCFVSAKAKEFQNETETKKSWNSPWKKNSVSLDKSLRASILPALKSELSTVSPAAPDGDIVVWPYDFSSLCVFLYFMYFYLCLYTTLRSEGDKAWYLNSLGLPLLLNSRNTSIIYRSYFNTNKNTLWIQINRPATDSIISKFK